MNKWYILTLFQLKQIRMLSWKVHAYWDQISNSFQDFFDENNFGSKILSYCCLCSYKAQKREILSHPGEQSDSPLWCQGRYLHLSFDRMAHINNPQNKSLYKAAKEKALSRHLNLSLIMLFCSIRLKISLDQ